MRRILLVLPFALLVRADDWDVPKPESKPSGKPIPLRLTLNRKKVHKATIAVRWELQAPEGARTVELDVKTEVRATGRNEQGEITVEAPLEITRLAAQGEDLTAQVHRSASRAVVTGQLNDKLQVAAGGTRGIRVGNLRGLVLPLASWVLPYLPGEPVRVGEVWSVPPQYLLWNIRQDGRGEVEGHVSAVLEAVEEKDGVRCARIRTVIGLRGKGGAGARFKGEIVSHVGLDGYLRASRAEVRMRTTDPKSNRTTDWTMTRTVAAGPADPTPRTEKDWSRHKGDLPFVVGYEAGMKEARFSGRPPMFVVTFVDSQASAALGATAWKDEAVLKNVAAYTPVLVDAGVEREFREKYAVVAEPAVLWTDLDGKLIFMAQGNSPLDLFRTSTEIARTQRPEVKPSAEYLALEKERDALREALAAGDVRTAVAKLLAIREVGMGVYIQQEADRTDVDLTERGRKRLILAAALLKQGKEDAARAQVEQIIRDYEGHPVAAEAAKMLPPR